MTDDLGWVALGVKPDASGFPSQLSGQIGPGMDVEGRRIGSRFSAGFKRAVIGAGIGGALTAGVKFAGDAISSASDLAESQNKVQQVFGKSADKIFEFTSKTADAYGQTNQQARDAAATFGIFGHAADLNEKKTAKFAIRMDKLASDLASFHNTSPEQAIQALGAALRGESEPIRSYGVLLDEASLKAEALKLGLIAPVKDQSKIQSYQVAIIDGQKRYNEAVGEYGKHSLEALKAEASLGTSRDRLKKATEGTIPPLTQQQKIIAAQKLIFEQTKVAQGDFARTSDGLANSQRRLSARWEDAKAKLGTALLPVMQDFVHFVLNKGIPAVEDFSDWAREDGAPMFKKVGDFIGDAAGHAKDLIGFLKDLPDPAKYAGLVALLGGAGLAKLRSGGGALGSAGKVLGISAPVKVFVTNPGFGAGGIGGVGGKNPRLANAVPLVGSLAVGGELLKQSGVPQKVSQHLFGTNEDTFGRVLDGDTQALADVRKQLKATSDYWDGYKLNADAAFDAVDRAVEHSIPLMKRYNSVLDGTPRQIKTWVGLSGYEKAIGQINTLKAGIDALASRGLDNGIPYAHGGQYVDKMYVQAHDYNDFVQQSQRKAQQAGMGGRP